MLKLAEREKLSVLADLCLAEREKLCLALSKVNSVSDQIAVIGENGHGAGTVTAALAAAEAGFTSIAVDSVEEALAVREKGGVRLREQQLYAWRAFEGGDINGKTPDAGLDCGFKLRALDIHIQFQPPLSAMAMCVNARATIYMENVEGARALCAASRQMASAEAFMHFRPTKVHIMLGTSDGHEGTHIAAKIAQEITCCERNPSEKESSGNPRLSVIEGLSSRVGSMQALRQTANEIKEATRIDISVRLHAHNSNEEGMPNAGACQFGWQPRPPLLSNILRWYTRVTDVYGKHVAKPANSRGAAPRIVLGATTEYTCGRPLGS